MATHAEAISAAGQSLDKEYDTLVNLMADISDGTIDGWKNGCETGEVTGHAIKTENGVTTYGYKIGGQEIDVATQRGSDRASFRSNFKDATKPGTMLQISTATSTQAVFTGQLTDTSMKATQLQKAVSQKIG